MRRLLTVRLSYASLEVAGQLVFCVISFYLLKFYTDVYGISAAAAGTILLFARIVDAVDTPVWGIIFDKTWSRWGKNRPWFLWLCVPFAVSGVLVFRSFPLGHDAKIAYAATTYVLCSILYTGINTPNTSILTGLTRDVQERVTLTTFRMCGSKFGVLFVNLTLLAAVAWLGRGNSQHGFDRVMPIYAVGTVALYLFAFSNLEEKVPDNGRRLAIRESLAALRGNAPWLIVFLNGLFFWIAFTARIVTAPYFFEYVMHRGKLVSIADSLDVVSLGTILFLPYFCRITSKKNVWILGLLGSMAAQVVIYFGVESHSLAIVMTGWTLGCLLSGVTMALPFALLPSSVDYGEWKTGIRAAGFLTAIGTSFCLNAGSGLGAALPAWIMSYFAYVPNVAQSARSLFGINLGCIWLPVVTYALALIPVLWYARYEQLEPQIRHDLEGRRGALEAASQI